MRIKGAVEKSIAPFLARVYQNSDSAIANMRTCEQVSKVIRGHATNEVGALPVQCAMWDHKLRSSALGRK